MTWLEILGEIGNLLSVVDAHLRAASCVKSMSLNMRMQIILSGKSAKDPALLPPRSVQASVIPRIV